MELLTAIPCMQTLDYNFVASIIDLHKPDSAAYCFEANSLITSAREHLAEQAIKYDAEYTLWLDSDMKIPADAYFKLKSYNTDIVTGIYFKRVPPYSPLIYTDLEVDENLRVLQGGRQILDYPKDSFFEISGCGMGCCLMKTQVLKDVKAAYGRLFNEIDGLGEDLSFQQKARKLGYHIYCDSSLKCGHVGAMVFDEASYEVYNGLVRPSKGETIIPNE